MASPQLLSAAMDNTAVPHQPYVVVSDPDTFGAVPVLREMIQRSIRRGSTVLLICALRSPSVFLGPTSGSAIESKVSVIDLTDRVPGYGADSNISSVKTQIVEAAEKLGPYTEVYVDGIDVFAEDYTPAGALSVVGAVLKLIKANKAPSRLVVSASPYSSFFPALLPPSLSSSLTLLHPHPLDLLSSLSTAYLAPIGASPRFLDLLDTATQRRSGERMAYLGESSIGDWVAGGTGKGKGKARAGGGTDGHGHGVAGVQVTVRKATGGAKGMSRSLEGLALGAPEQRASGSAASLAFTGLRVTTLEAILDLSPFSRATTTAPAPAMANGSSTDNGPNRRGQTESTHSALNLPFSLSLTDEQRRRRDVVPIPYVHEGEGVELGWEEEEDDEDDEEI